jgi:hypothetical protein
MKAMMDSRYVGWMAVRPLQFGKDTFEPGDRIPQKHLETMRDPEVLVRTGRIRAVAKDLNKVPRYLRKDVMLESEAKEKILTPRASGQNGPVVLSHLIGTVHDPTSKVHKSAKRAAQKAEEERQAELEAAQKENPAPVVPEGTPYPTPPTPSIAGVGPDGQVINAQEETPVAEVEAAVAEQQGEQVEYVEEPARNASTEEWAKFAVDTGQATEEEVADMNRAELIEKYAVPEDEE